MDPDDVEITDVQTRTCIRHDVYRSIRLSDRGRKSRRRARKACEGD